MTIDLSNYKNLTTPHVADACMRLEIPVRSAPAGMHPLWSNTHMVGPVRPAQHSGSVDVFLEALEHATAGDVLVVDNGGRQDEACVGDLVALEASHAGLAGILIWGLHRDSAELRTIGLPIISLGSLPPGPASVQPQTIDALATAQCGNHTVTLNDFVLADDDGVLFLPQDRSTEIAELAATIRDTERRQASLMAAGTSLREQMRFSDYLSTRSQQKMGFREHLRTLGGAIEE